MFQKLILKPVTDYHILRCQMLLTISNFGERTTQSASSDYEGFI